LDGFLETLSRSWFVAFLLLSVRGQNLYGYELTERMARLGFGATRPGKVYHTLRLMEEEGLIFPERSGPEYLLSQRRYGRTGPGEAYLEFLAHTLEQYHKEIELFLRTYEGLPAHEVHG
jgi:DNA-binding PadR family transcriptional regulator